MFWNTGTSINIHYKISLTLDKMFTFNSTYNEVQRELKDALKQNVLLTTKLDESKRYIQKFASAKKKWEKGHKDLGEMYSNKLSEILKIRSQVDEVVKDLGTLANNVVGGELKLRNELTGTKFEDNFQKIMALLSIVKKFHQATIDELKESKKLSDQTNQTLHVLEETQNECDDQKKALQDQREEIAELKARVAHYEASLKLNNDIIEKLESEKAKLTNDLKETKNQLNAFSQVVQSLNYKQYREDVRAGAKRKRLKDITPLD